MNRDKTKGKLSELEQMNQIKTDTQKNLIQSLFRQDKEIKREDNCLQTSFVYEAYLKPKTTKYKLKWEMKELLRRLSLCSIIGNKK